MPKAGRSNASPAGEGVPAGVAGWEFKASKRAFAERTGSKPVPSLVEGTMAKERWRVYVGPVLCSQVSPFGRVTDTHTIGLVGLWEYQVAGSMTRVQDERELVFQ